MNPTIKYLIVEDERFAYEEIKRMVERLRPGYLFAQRTESVADTVAFLENNSVDLILLDIRLADGTCFEIFEQLKVSTPIIFTTAYDEHAIKAFKVNSIDYLLKPIEESDLLTALEKYEQLKNEKQTVVDYKKLEETLLGRQKKNRFLVQVGDVYHSINTTDIAFFYSEDKVVFLHTFSNKKYIIDYTLDQTEQQLDERNFFRVSRSCIANINSIKRISKYFNSRIKLTFEPDCPLEILVSRVRVPDFLRWVDGVL